MMERERAWQNPYGDGTAGRKIVEIVGTGDHFTSQGGAV